MKHMIGIAVLVYLMTTTVSAQFHFDPYSSNSFPLSPSSYPSFSYYSPPSSFGGIRMAAARDPRANTGPVVFPPSPEGDPNDTSGVIVGASGYGFVPPNGQGSGAVSSYSRFFYNDIYLRR